MFSRLLPAREKHPTVKILSDFDKMVSESVGFKFHGKVYVMKPVNVGNFMSVTLAYQGIIQMMSDRSEGKGLNDEDVYLKYFDLISPIVPEITFAEVRSMTLVVLNQLINLIYRQLAGDPSLYSDVEKKKFLNPPTL